MICIYMIYIYWIQKILTAKNIYIRHFEICYVILRTQITTCYTSTLKSLREGLIQQHMDI